MVNLLDSTGNLLNLPYDLTLPFARYLARSDITHLKRYSVDKIFRMANASQPVQPLECDFDIVDSTSTADMLPEAEVIKVTVEILHAFPSIHSHGLNLRVSHARVAQAIFDYCQIPSAYRVQVGSSLTQLNKHSWSQIKKHLQKQNLVSTTSLARLEGIIQIKYTGENDDYLSRIGSKLSDFKPAAQAIKDLRLLFRRLRALDVKCKTVFDPTLMYNLHYFNGVIFQVALHNRVTKEMEVFAAGGRYDELVKKFRHAPTHQALCAVGVNLAIEKIMALHYAYQQEEQGDASQPLKSNDVDVYVCSIRGQPGDAEATTEKLLSERLLVTSELWTAGIAAEVMRTDEGLTVEELQMTCKKLGYSWMVIITDKFTRAQSLKVKSVTRKTEVDVFRPGLVDLLRKLLQVSSASASATGTAVSQDALLLDQESVPSPSTATSAGGPKVDVNVLLDSTLQEKKKGDFKKKTAVIAKASDKFHGLRRQLAQQKAVEIIAVDLTLEEVRALLAVDVAEDSSFKQVTDQYTSRRRYLATVREAMLAARKKGDASHVVLYSVKDEVAEYYHFWR